MSKDARLHLRLDGMLLRRLKRMAEDHNETVSALVIRYLEYTVTRHEEAKGFVKDAEQV